MKDYNEKTIKERYGKPAVSTFSSGFKDSLGRSTEPPEDKIHKKTRTETVIVGSDGTEHVEKSHEHASPFFSPHRNFGRYYMGYQDAILKMVDNSKLTMKVFDFLFRNANQFNIIDFTTQKDLTETFKVSRQTISKIMKFLREEEIIDKVKGKLMINPFLVVTANSPADSVVTAQHLWDTEVGFYGNPEDKAEVAGIVADIKRKNKNKAKSVATVEAKEYESGLKDQKKEVEKTLNNKEIK